ncbi:MAG: hypothetical protein OXP09_06745 [Gammaproteobacteria bacterium]|nr:hypothetical protein [Gammaproteobacteria bacterium]MDE0365258.1 hypothetical protein [Gammaproteobacteria bacterium]
MNRFFPIALLALLIAPPASAGFADSLRDTKPDFNVRYRFENVDQDGIEKKARASTAKARLSWIMPADDGLSFGFEVDQVLSFPPGSEQKFNSTENGKTQYPVVADPLGFDLNQVFLRYRSDGLILTAGRQRILHAEQRFLGGVAFRQNEQTYDGLRLQYARGMASLDYTYIINVNRIFGPGDGAQPGDWKGDTHAFRGELKPAEGHTFGAFGYLMDFENDNGPANSNSTYGVDYTASLGPLSMTGTLARQSDYADNPDSYDATYYALEASLKRDSLTFTGGYAVLGSDGGEAAFKTPLGTLHKFQGWTDRFLATPLNGVANAYATVTSRTGPVVVTLAYHDFQAEKGGADYGYEIGASLSWKINDNFDAQLKFADYSAKEHATDITKFWFTLSYRI